MSTSPGEDRELGFAGMLAAGIPPRVAWEAIRDECAKPEVRAIFDHLRESAEGLAALECARQAWARHDLPAPFDDTTGGDQ